MHFEEKAFAISKVSSLLNDGGIFLLSVDKNRADFIDMVTRKVKIFPDSPKEIKENALLSGLELLEEFETEFAFIFVMKK